MDMSECRNCGEPTEGRYCEECLPTRTGSSMNEHRRAQRTTEARMLAAGLRIDHQREVNKKMARMMRASRIVGVGLVLVALLVGCGNVVNEPEVAPTPTPETVTVTPEPEPPVEEFDDGYDPIGLLRDQQPEFDSWTDDEVIGTAVIICEGIDELPIGTVVTITMDNTDTPEGAGALVAYAVFEHCPEHMAEFDLWTERF